MTCPSGVRWGYCLDMPCQVDPHNPALAICQCQLKTTQQSLTFGGGCDTRTCMSVIWSAATSDLPGVKQYTGAMKKVGHPVTLPPSCPGASS